MADPFSIQVLIDAAFSGNPELWVPLVWAGLLATAVALYVILDGFDLGIGILFPWMPAEDDRDVMMNSVAPFWDGNETWLILGGGGLFVAFPLAYGIIMPAVYLPLIIMLLALVFRGVAFEFRWVAKPKHAFWDYAFAWGSIVASFCQGVILGEVLLGLPVKDGEFAGGALDWLEPFPLFTGLAVVLGYGLLGATWLIMKTEGEVATAARRYAKPLLLAVLGAMVVISVWTPFAIPRVWDRWFTLPNLFYLAPIPILSAVAAFICWRGLAGRAELSPFFAAIALFMLGFLGLVVSNAPYMVPPSISVWDAAAPLKSQMFLLVGTVVLLPFILGYTAFSYYAFRGKVRHGEGYH